MYVMCANECHAVAAVAAVVSLLIVAASARADLLILERNCLD